MKQVESERFEESRQRYANAAAATDDWVVAWETLQKYLTRQWKISGARADLDALIEHFLDLPKLAPVEKRRTVWLVKRLDLIINEIDGLEAPCESDLEHALLLSRLSLESVPADQPALRALIKAQIAELLLRFHDVIGDTNKLKTAVDEAEDAAKINVVDRSDRCRVLGVLGTALRRKYVCFGSHDDLRRSEWATRCSLELIPREEAVAGSLRCLGLYQNLANALCLLFELTGDPRHLDEAIELGHKSLAGEPKGDDADRCSSLVSSLTWRGRLNNNMNDLNAALSIMDKLEAMLSPMTSARQQATMYDHWGRAYQAKYELTNQLQDLEKAILTGKKAVALFESFQEGRFKASMAQQMLILYTKKYKRSKHLDDALEGLRYGKMSIQFEDVGARMLGAHFSQLSILYQTMFHRTGKREYLEHAMSEAKKSLEFRANSAIAQNNMACRFLVVYKMDGTPEDLDSALHHIGLAFSASEDSRISRAALLSTAGEANRLKYETTLSGVGNGSDANTYLLKAIDYFTQSARHPESLPLNRIEAARFASKLLARQPRWELAYELLHEAMDWIPKLVPIHMNSTDQKAIVTSISGLAAEACSAALACGRVREAIEELERGRGILIASAHKALHDVEKLQEKSPDLFRRYCRTRDQLLGAASSVEDEVNNGQVWLDIDTRPQTSQSHSRVEALNAQMEYILKEIRSISGLHQFLEPISSSEMQQLCGTKCVVALNSSQFGAHAILINRERIWSIVLPEPLHIPNFTGALQAGVRVMERIVHSTEEDDQYRNNSLLQGLLNILWHHIAGPVTRELCFNHVGRFNSNDEMVELMFSRRILWLPTGHYSRFPIHAAGVHDGNGKDTLCGRAVLSSYIASFRLLRFSQGISTDLPSRTRKGLLLSMEPREEDSDGSLYPPYAATEVEEVTTEAKTIIDWEVMRRPTRTQTLNNASTCSWLHVVSHGVSDTSNPSASYLVLEADEDDASSHALGSRLTVQQISELRASHGILAFISACSTAESRVGPLLDESISLGYAFQVAGFPHVVGCLWPAYGFVCSDFAAFFYRYLAQYGSAAGRPLTNDLIAFCIHYAVMSIMIHHDCIREKEPLLWAGFVHIGP